MRVERQQPSGANGNGDRPATEKQLAFLATLGVEAPAGCTRKMASQLIDEARQ